MDAELLLTIIVGAIWMIGSLIAGAKKRKSSSIPPPPPQRQAQSYGGVRRPPQQPVAQPPRKVQTLGDAFRQILDGAGLELPDFPGEQPVASEHTVTWDEHQPTWSETVPTGSETVMLESEQRRTASETFLTPSEHQLVASEHRLSPGEHSPGDAWASSELSPWAIPPEAGDAGLGAVVVNDLRSGPASLARAVILHEILSPPIALRSSGDRL